jgi:hypothetical protein
MMSSSDSAMFAELVARVDQLEAVLADLLRRFAEMSERVEGKELHGELYGPEVDHAADREARRGPGRPPNTDRPPGSTTGRAA